MAVSLATLTMEITADSSGAEKALARTGAAVDSAAGKVTSAKQSFADFGSSLNSIGATMSLAFTAPLAAIGVASLDAASDLNEALLAVHTVFGDSSDIITDFASESAANLGITEEAALSAAGRLGALGSGLGFVGDDLANFSVDIIQAATDLSSFYNVDQATALDALRSGLVGETEPLRQFGILLDAASVEAQAMAMGLGDATGALSQQDLVMARQVLILDQLGAAQGDFARTSDGLANSQRILMAEVGNLSAELGAVLLPIALDVVSAMLDFVPTISSLIAGFQTLDPGIQTAALGFVALLAAAGPVALALGGLVTVVGALLSPVGLVVLASAALFTLYQTNSGFADAVNAALGVLHGLFIEIAGFITGSVVPAFQNLIQLGQNMATAFGEGGLSAALGVLGAAFATAFQTISDTVQTKLQEVSDALADWLNEQGASFEAGLLAMQETAASVWVTIQNDIGARIEGIRTHMTEVWESIQTFIGEALTTVQTTISTAWEDIQSGALTAMSELLATISATFDLIRDDVGTKVGEMKTGLLTTITTMKDEAISLVSGLKDDILGVFADAGTWLVDAGAEIIGGLIAGIQSQFDALGSAVGGALDILGGLGDITISNPFDQGGGGGGGNANFRGRAHGGPVMADTAYWVGEAGPELFMPGRSGFVMPHGQSMALAGAGGGTTQNIHIEKVEVRDGTDLVETLTNWQRSSALAASRSVS